MGVKVTVGFRLIGMVKNGKAGDVQHPLRWAASFEWFLPLLLKVHKGAAALAGKCLWVDKSLITSLVKGVFVFAQH